MPGLGKTLPVPYFTQPTGNTCQSTVLKMMAASIEQYVILQSTGAAARTIQDILKDAEQLVSTEPVGLNTKDRRLGRYRAVRTIW